MNLLNNLDEEYKNLRTNGEKLYDGRYYYYQKIDFKDSYSNNTFWCLKQRKTRFVIIKELNNVKLYLSDADIIEIIASLNSKEFGLLMESFNKMYRGDSEEFFFRIGDQNYTTLGLKFLDVEKRLCFSIQIETKADIHISFEDLIYVLNLILAKEQAAMNLAKKTNFNRLKRQLAKYIVLSKFYKCNDENCKTYLQQIGYDVIAPDIHTVYNDDRKQRHIDNKFNDEEIFERLFIK